MRQKSAKQLHRITLEYANGVTREVKAKATSRELAEKQALKRNPGALRVKSRG